MKTGPRITLIFTILLACSAFINTEQFTPVADATAVRKKIAEVSQNTVSIRSDFVQEKNLSMLSEKVISKGVFYFKKENRVRLEYVKPFKYLMVINNGKILVKDDEKTTQLDMHKSKIFQEVNNIIINCVKGSVVSGTDFSVMIFENPTQIKLEMQPVSKSLKDFFKSIFVFINTNSYTVDRIEMNEISGDNTIISFTNKQINGTIDDALFAVK